MLLYEAVELLQAHCFRNWVKNSRIIYWSKCYRVWIFKTWNECNLSHWVCTQLSEWAVNLDSVLGRLCKIKEKLSHFLGVGSLLQPFESTLFCCCCCQNEANWLMEVKIPVQLTLAWMLHRKIAIPVQNCAALNDGDTGAVGFIFKFLCFITARFFSLLVLNVSYTLSGCLRY